MLRFLSISSSGATQGCTELVLEKSKKQLLSMGGNVLQSRAHDVPLALAVGAVFRSFASKDVSKQKRSHPIKTFLFLAHNTYNFE